MHCLMHVAVRVGHSPCAPRCVQLKILAPSKLCGAVIGKEGRTITNFKEDSKCEIRVQVGAKGGPGPLGRAEAQCAWGESLGPWQGVHGEKNNPEGRDCRKRCMVETGWEGDAGDKFKWVEV